MRTTLRAESLRRVAEPLATALRAGPAPPREVVRALVEALQPVEAELEPPDWLRPEQRPLVRRAAAAILRHGGALLATPVGSGKTWMALALARLLAPDDVVPVLTPTPLRSHWLRVATALGVEIRVGTHASASLGRLPEGSRFAIVDESQHLRTPSTRRHRHVARWLVGRRALLLSATPVVNRPDDLAAQLLLTVRDSALAAAGVPSLAALLADGMAHPALGELVIASARARPCVPGRTVPTDDDGTPIARAIDALQLSSSAPVRELLRRVFWRAAASSPAALLESVRRYEALLRHVEDAAAAGRRVDRALLRSFTGPDGEQLALWSLLPDASATDLVIDDRDALDALARLAVAATSRDDARVATLRALIADGRRSVVFTTRRATLAWLRSRLDDARLAWCTGREAGIGRGRAGRAAVLDWFRSDAAMLPAAAALAPRHLLATDVAAEGLDLGRADRVVHYDLPWTDARMAQREGRLARGAVRPCEVVTIPPPPALAVRLDLHGVLARKRMLPIRLGLVADGEHAWLWRERLRDIADDVAPRCGLARVDSERTGVLVGHRIDDGSGPASVSLTWLADGEVIEDASMLRALLREAASATPLPLGGGERRAVLARVASHLRGRLRASQRSAWQPAPGREGVARLLGRLWELARRAARERDPARLARLQSAMRFVGGGHTAGEAALVAELAGADDVALRRALPTLPAPAVAAIPALSLVGAIAFGSPLAPGPRATTFGRHDALHDGPLRPRRHADRLDPADHRQLSPHAADPRLPGPDG